MKTSIKKELAGHIIDKINDGVIDDSNKEEWHYYCFNEDYYIIGYYQASEWLKEHGIDSFEAISICQEYEKYNFGECQIYNNSEKTVNMLVYIYGKELIYSENWSDIDELKEVMEKIIAE